MAKHLHTYSLFAQGPDNHSTYAECWGSTAASPGRLIVTGTATEISAALEEIGHKNVANRLNRRKGVQSRWLTVEDFRAKAPR